MTIVVPDDWLTNPHAIRYAEGTAQLRHVVGRMAVAAAVIAVIFAVVDTDGDLRPVTVAGWGIVAAVDGAVCWWLRSLSVWASVAAGLWFAGWLVVIGVAGVLVWPWDAVRTIAFVIGGYCTFEQFRMAVRNVLAYRAMVVNAAAADD